MRIGLALTGMFALAAGQAAAQAPASPGGAETGPLSISGSVRLRYEAIDGQARAGFNASDDLLNLRTRLAVDYDAGGIRFGGEVFDSRVYGDDQGTPVSTGEVNTLEIVQAFVAADLTGAGGARATVQAGRFMLNVGSRRLVAADDFRNTTNGYTGVRVDTALGAGVNATAVYVLPQFRLPTEPDALDDNVIELDRETSDLVLWGGLVDVPAGPAGAVLQPTYFRLDERDRADLPTRDRRLDTFGVRWFREPADRRFDFDIEVIGQTGSVSRSSAPGAPSQKVRADYQHAEIGYRWPTPFRTRLAIEFDRASGDAPGGDYGRFDTLFGMRRAEIAPSGLYNAVGRANLVAAGLRLEVEPSARWDAFVTWKALFLDEATDAFSTSGVRDVSGLAGEFAGNQVDARVRYWLAPRRLRLELTGVVLAHGGFLKKAPNGPDGGATAYGAIDVTALF
jgi:hypothetical protein